MPSFKTPTQDQIDIAVQRMRSPEFEAYFFARLNNPRWLSPLKGRGLFASPPPVIAAETGSTTYPYWPASSYLARMAKHAPDEVAKIFAKYKDRQFVGDKRPDRSHVSYANTSRCHARAHDRTNSTGIHTLKQSCGCLCPPC